MRGVLGLVCIVVGLAWMLNIALGIKTPGVPASATTPLSPTLSSNGGLAK